MPGIIVTPETRDFNELASALSALLQSRLEGAGDVSISNLGYPRGAGMSHETILFDTSWVQGGARYRRGCVVRTRPRAIRCSLYVLRGAIQADAGAARAGACVWPSCIGLSRMPPSSAPLFLLWRKSAAA